MAISPSPAEQISGKVRGEALAEEEETQAVLYATRHCAQQPPGDEAAPSAYHTLCIFRVSLPSVYPGYSRAVSHGHSAAQCAFPGPSDTKPTRHDNGRPPWGPNEKNCPCEHSQREERSGPVLLVVVANTGEEFSIVISRRICAAPYSSFPFPPPLDGQGSGFQ